MFRFEQLDVWKDALQFARRVYALLRKFPKEELFALADQLRRAVVSISANIAEGSGSNSHRDFRNYLGIAIKSTFEVVSLLAVAEQNGYVTTETFEQLRGEAEILVKRIQALRNSLS
ncbi:MAG: four helix bundle protein [Candidatus Harrisonbacteria bacterium]|nr:four helix bundle protein [Candidatus Harrisonbacteria bacterium]